MFFIWGIPLFVPTIIIHFVLDLISFVNLSVKVSFMNFMESLQRRQVQEDYLEFE